MFYLNTNVGGGNQISLNVCWLVIIKHPMFTIRITPGPQIAAEQRCAPVLPQRVEQYSYSIHPDLLWPTVQHRAVQYAASVEMTSMIRHKFKREQHPHCVPTDTEQVQFQATCLLITWCTYFQMLFYAKSVGQIWWDIRAIVGKIKQENIVRDKTANLWRHIFERYVTNL